MTQLCTTANEESGEGSNFEKLLMGEGMARSRKDMLEDQNE